MPKICYTQKKFKVAALARIEEANAIAEDYVKQGLTLTLRQLFYRLVARGTIPNTFRSYKNLQAIINDARLAGLLDWNSIEDRTRNMNNPYFNDDPQDAIEEAAWRYRLNLWETQPYHVEVWVEKDALLGVVEKACRQHRLPYFSCRGYTSQSEVWGSARRLQNAGKPVVVLHLGDHDPSGVDMTRDIEDRFHLFGAHNVRVERLGLNMDQIRELNPPPNPVKFTDSRANGYNARFGDESWELDALEPNYIIDLIHRATEKYIDIRAWSKALEPELADKADIRKIGEHYTECLEFINRTNDEEE